MDSMFMVEWGAALVIDQSPEYSALGFRVALVAGWTTRALVLTVVHPNWGTVSISPLNSQPLKLPPGSSITLTATPVQGKIFQEWTIWNDPNRYPDPNYCVIDGNPVLQLTMGHDYAVEATFGCSSGLAPILPLMAVGFGGLALLRRRRWA